MLPTQVVRCEAEPMEQFHSQSRAPGVSGDLTSLQDLGTGVCLGAYDHMKKYC